ncbi:MAG TPA: DegT/DnrJ/EryC1/StrS family aminotransferase [Bryobacteraceae bacterium]|jgi:dTDP-4-amino-4,6-dideoxygalactose transaminase
MISSNNFARQWLDIQEDAMAAFRKVGESGWYVLGNEVREFEAALAAHWGIEHGIGVASGLDAIEISLKILGCTPGDPVLTTPLSAFATTLAILKVGAVPVFIDTDERGLLNLDRCRDLFWRRPDIRFFVPVHLYGHALDVAALRRLRGEFGVHIVEDCAQSIGSRFRGEATGAAGQIAATSFYPTKNLGALGDGGAILTANPEWREQAAALRDYGQSAKYRHEVVGYNSRLDELQAALLHQVMLPRLTGWIDRRRAIAARYTAEISHPEVHCPGAPEGSESNWHLFPVLVPPERKSAFMEHLKTSGVQPAEHYPVIIPDQPVMAHSAFDFTDDCANARRVAASEVSLPIHPYLIGEEVARVIEAVNGWRPAPS